MLADNEWTYPHVLYLFALMLVLFIVSLVKQDHLKQGHFFVDTLRILSLALCLLALAGPYVRETKELHQISALLDVSKSVSESAQRQFLQKMLDIVKGISFQRDEKLELLLGVFADGFAKEKIAISRNDTVDRLMSLVTKLSTQINTNNTSISDAIRNLTENGYVSSVLIMSDGLETKGNIVDLIKNQGIEGVRIYPIMPDLKQFNIHKFEISTLYAPLAIGAEEKADVRISLHNTLETTTSGRVELFVDEQKILSKNVDVASKEESLITSDIPVLEGGLHRIRALLYGNDQGHVQEVHRWISVKSKQKLLLLNGEEDDEKVLAKLLSLKGFSVESLVADIVKKRSFLLKDYSAVIFNNIAAQQLPKDFLNTLKKEVESSGCGVVILGGVRSFGLGGYVDSPLDEISPLKFIPPQTKKKRINSGVVLLLDKSRSMKDNGKIDAAKRSAYVAINSLKDGDLVSVIGFDVGPFEVIPLIPVAQAKELADRRLRNLIAAEKTDVLPAMALARKSLANAQVGRRHIILLTDGKFGAYEAGAYQEVLTQLRNDGITISTVAIGSEADAPLLKMFASVGKGAFYQTLDPLQLPEIFVQDIKVTTGEDTMSENAEFAVIAGPGGVVSTSISRFPSILGFVESLPKNGSTLELITKKGENVYPIMGSWAFGSGKVISFTSDANGRWSYPWLKWDNFHRFWSDLLSKVKRPLSDKESQLDFDLRSSVLGDSLVFDLTLYDDLLHSNRNACTIEAKVEKPFRELESLSFNSVGGERFRAVLDKGRSGDYRLNISCGNTSLPTLAVTIADNSFGEMIGQGVDVQKLADLAKLSGGVINPSISDVVSTKEQVTAKQIFPPLVILVVILVILEAFVREGSWRNVIRKRKFR